jgi:hypothetical protein
MGTKAAFVRSNPNLPAQELVTLAEKQGIPLTVGHVYNIRAIDKSRKAERQEGKAAANGRAAPERGSSALDAQLRTLIIRIGLDRAEQIFAELKKGLSRLGAQ